MSKSQRQARKWNVEGHVQGVGFRFFVQHKAVALGITGWARNLDDGSVEVVGIGTPERLDDLGASLYLGPQQADVRAVNPAAITTDEETKARALQGFNIS